MDLNSIVLIGFYIIILIYSIIIHEVMHGYVALWLGDSTAKYADRLNFNPLSHIDPVGSIFVPLLMLVTSGFHYAFGWAKPVPYNPFNLKDQKWGPMLVALGGPGSNIVLALVAAIIARLIALPTAIKGDIILSVAAGNWTQLSTFVAGSFGAIVFTLMTMVIFWNVLLAFFNLIPFPPLDGSKILFTFFPVKMETMIMLEQYGFMLLLLFVFIFSTPMGIFLNTMLSLFFGMTI
ncbi:MAG: site-2 protease family protein [Candidatus Moraniibacteriota bacterium]